MVKGEGGHHLFLEGRKSYKPLTSDGKSKENWAIVKFVEKITFY